MKCRKIESIRDISNNIISISKSSDIKLDFAIDYFRLFNSNILSKHDSYIVLSESNYIRGLLYAFDEGGFYGQTGYYHHNSIFIPGGIPYFNKDSVKTLKDYKKERGE